MTNTKNVVIGPTPKEIGQIVTAYTGIICGNFQDFHAYAEKLMGRSIFTHEFGNKDICEQIKKKSKDDFLRMSEWISGII